MRNLLAFLLFLCLHCYSFCQQTFYSNVSSASFSNQYSFSIGEIYIEGSSGLLGSYSFISNYKVDVKDLNEKDQFIVVPNPVVNSFQIKTNGSSKIQSVVIFNENGQQIGRLNASENTDISHYPTGTYFVKINGTNAIKLIKN